MTTIHQEEQCSWNDYKHLTFFDRQRYSIQSGLLSIEVGMLSRKRSTVPLYMIEKIQEQRSLLQLLFNLSTFIIWVHDADNTVIRLENVNYDNGSIYEDISYHIHMARQKMLKGYHYVEYTNSTISGNV